MKNDRLVVVTGREGFDTIKYVAREIGDSLEFLEDGTIVEKSRLNIVSIREYTDSDYPIYRKTMQYEHYEY